MSSEPVAVPQPPRLDALAPGVRGYTFACMAAALVMVLPLLMRGVGTTALLPAVFGVLLPLLRWRAGPVVLLVTLAWLALADKLGTGPLQLLFTLVEAVLRLFFDFTGRAGFFTNSVPKLERPMPVLDVLLCASVVVYIAAYCRLLSVTRNIFPVDGQRRAPSKGFKPSGAPKLGPVIEQKRSPLVTDPSEIGNLASAAVGCAALAQILALVMAKRTARSDLTFMLGRNISVSIDEGVWRALVLVWVFALLLLLVTGVMSYFGHRRLTPAEAGLYLQDQLWRQTRREQARLSRWLAWAEKKEARRRARRQEKSP